METAKPTQTANVIWYPRGERLVIDAAQYAVPDRRDERIATLEAALRHIRTLAGEALAYVFLPPDELVETIHKLASNALAGAAQPTSTVDEAMAI